MELIALFRRHDGGLFRTVEGLELARHFQLVKTLGSGSFSTVYEVRRRSDNCLYALKHIDILRAVDPSERAEFLADLVNEIRLLASLQHPNILRYYEAFVERHHFFIVTELSAGGDLAALLEKHAEQDEQLPEPYVWSLFLQIMLGLQYMHRNHVLHRDLKPQNVLIAAGGLLKLADFGISVVLDESQALTNRLMGKPLMGTPHYVSPELWRKEPHSYPADVWALGCILQEMCTLRSPFLAPSNREIREKVLCGLLDPIPPRYSIELWDLIRVMLTPFPADRPAMDELLALPSVRAHMDLLPAECQDYISRPHDRANILATIQIPSQLDNSWERLNDLLPRPSYPTGLGVAQALPRARILSSGAEDLGMLEEARLREAPDSSGLGPGKQWAPSRRVRVTRRSAALAVSAAGLLCTCTWCLLFDCFALFAWGGQ